MYLYYIYSLSAPPQWSIGPVQQPSRRVCREKAWALLYRLLFLFYFVSVFIFSLAGWPARSTWDVCWACFKTYWPSLWCWPCPLPLMFNIQSSYTSPAAIAILYIHGSHLPVSGYPLFSISFFFSSLLCCAFLLPFCTCIIPGYYYSLYKYTIVDRRVRFWGLHLMRLMDRLGDTRTHQALTSTLKAGGQKWWID